MKILFFSLLSLFLFWGCHNDVINGVSVKKRMSVVTIDNGLISVKYDLGKGTYCAFDKSRNIEAISNASSQINQFNTESKGVSNSYTVEPIIEKLGKGLALLIKSKKDNFPNQLFKIKLFDNQSYIILQSGIENDLSEPYVIKKLSPVANTSIFKGLNLNENFRVIDGEGGGIETYIRKEPTILSQNNIILSFGNRDNRFSLVAGGATYREFEKFVSITEEWKREPDFMRLTPHLTLLEYIDLGDTKHDSLPQYMTIDKFEHKTKFKFAGSFAEAKSIIYDRGDIRIDLKKLDRTKNYILGIVWGSNYPTHKQSVILLKNGKEEELLPSTLLPDLSIGKEPDLFFFSITPDMMQTGMPAIVIRKDGGANTVLSEIAVFEGTLSKEKIQTPIMLGKAPSEFKNVKFNLYAEDPVGKLVDPGKTYLPDNDAFYIDFSTINPLESAEKYSSTVKELQDVKLNYYHFPTICLWVAMQPLYGGQGEKSTRATNDSPGAVAEMKRVKDSGWLKYTTMGIRLVPDCYAENNENGWWDDKHWQMYGSGSEERQGTKEMNLPGGHYRKPYETTQKWAQSVIDLGGLPFIYFQTAVRSKDYCEQNPSHMLHNQSFYIVENQQNSLNNQYGTYDFTDKNFVAHMKSVYKNLNSAGIAGMMFDYPYTAWAPYGGMDDKYCTTAGHYRKVFELATGGLGPKSYVHERNIRRGSDLTMGVVQSQRIWGDNDVLTAEMVMRGGLRWYKNRVLYNYDMDAKSLSRAIPSDSDDGINKLLTMSYVTASRLLLGQSFARTSSKNIFKLSRIFPYHQSPQSARPVDAFSSDYPRVYDFKVDDKWHQLTYFNEDNENPKTISTNLSDTPGFGGLGLDKNSTYYVYDFWNNQLVGEFKGDAILSQNLRKGEARMMSVRHKENHPQILSTDRHLMQGYIELSDVSWDDNKLTGKAKMIKNEPLKIIVATNGFAIQKVRSSDGIISYTNLDKGLIEITLISPLGTDLDWVVEF